MSPFITVTSDYLRKTHSELILESPSLSLDLTRA